MTFEEAKEFYEAQRKEFEITRLLLETESLSKEQRNRLTRYNKEAFAFLYGIEIGKQLESEYRFL